MAHDEARAQRVRELKASRPDLTWRRIADAVGVGERSAHHWQETGGMKYTTAKKLAEVFGVDHEWLWSGRTGETPDLMGALSPNREDDEDGRVDQLDEIIDRLDRIEEKLDLFLDDSRRADIRRAIVAETVSELAASGDANELLAAFQEVAEAEPHRRSARRSSGSPSRRKRAPS